MTDSFRLTIECSVGISELNIKFSESGPIVTQSKLPRRPESSTEDVLAARVSSVTKTNVEPSEAKPSISNDEIIPDVDNRPVAADKEYAAGTY